MLNRDDLVKMIYQGGAITKLVMKVDEQIDDSLMTLKFLLFLLAGCPFAFGKRLNEHAFLLATN